MFLTKNNSIRWNRLIIGLVITVVLCVCGVLWIDQPLYLFLHQFNWGIWRAFGAVFSSKVWLLASALLVGYVYIKKTVKSKSKVEENVNRFSFVRFLKDFIQKTKTSTGFFIFCSVLSASLVAAVLKVVLGRARPVFLDALGLTGFYPFTAEWAFNSMPSGHATASFAALVMIGLLEPKIKWATWTLAIIIGISRVCVGAHFPSDVLLGAFIGMVAADIIKSALGKPKQPING